MERYSRLQPLTLDLRRKIALAAVNFFSPINYRKMCEMVGKAADPKAIQPMSLRDFVKCLEVTGLLPEADRYQQRIRGLVERLAAADIFAIPLFLRRFTSSASRASGTFSKPLC